MIGSNAYVSKTGISKPTEKHYQILDKVFDIATTKSRLNPEGYNIFLHGMTSECRSAFLVTSKDKIVMARELIDEDVSIATWSKSDVNVQVQINTDNYGHFSVSVNDDNYWTL